jgi:hypothetical protein
MFKYQTNGKARFFLAIGPQFDLLLSAKQDYKQADLQFSRMIQEEGWETAQDVGATDIKDRYNSLDIMGRMDLGLDVTLVDNLFLNFGLTLSYGLLDINATEWQIPDHSSGSYNASHNVYGGLNLGLNYRIPLGKK